jgi:hypothetical protein
VKRGGKRKWDRRKKSTWTGGEMENIIRNNTISKKQEKMVCNEKK